MALSDIETIVIVILENRSFDHALGYLSLAGADPAMPVEGLQDDRPGAPRMPASTTARHFRSTASIRARKRSRTRRTRRTPSRSRSMPAGGPARDGRVRHQLHEAQPRVRTDPKRVMGYYEKDGVPIFDFFARNFAVCDHWFAALPTGTQANR